VGLAYIQPVRCNWSFTNSIGAGCTCGFAIPPGSGGCWPRWPNRQQTPIIVVAAEGQADRYLVIDGYKRITALQQLGQDTVEVVVCPRSWSF
jgi:hypothetical protein